MATKKKTDKPIVKRKSIAAQRQAELEATKKNKNKPIVVTPNNPWRPTVWTDDLIDLEAEALIKWCKNQSNYFFTSFLNERGYLAIQAERFAAKHEGFSKAYAQAKQIQEQRLVELGVSKKGDGNFIKFILQNKAGWKDRAEVSGDGVNPLTMILDRIGVNSRDPIEDFDE